MKAAVHQQRFQAAVIGGSAGAVGALLSLLPQLPEDYPLALMIVVHLPPEGESTLAALLNGRSSIRVKEAEDKELIRPGMAYLAPPNYHLLVDTDLHLTLSMDDPELYSRPSINVLFESAADAYGDSLAGVILTGASKDGASGLRSILNAGGIGYVQSPATAESPIMPQAAIKLCPEATVANLDQLALLLKTELVS